MALLNPSFEIAGGLPARAVAIADPPYVVSEGSTFLLRANEGDWQSVVFIKGSFAAVSAAAPGPYAFADGDTLDVLADGVLYPFVLAAADFDDIGEVTAFEIIEWIAGQIAPVFGLGYFDETLSIASLTQGSGGSIQVTGTAAAAMGIPGGLVIGQDFFADLSAVETAELVAYLTPRLVDVVVDDEAGHPRFSTILPGDTSTLEFGGVIAAVLDLPTTPRTGTSLQGSAWGWTILGVGTRIAWLDFALLDDVPAQPYESFGAGWGYDGLDLFPPALGVDDLDVGVQETFEAGWGSMMLSLGPTISGPVEPFGWPVPPATEIDDSPVSVAGITEVFDGADWGGFDDSPASAAYDFTIWGGTSTSEEFGDDPGNIDAWSTLAATHVVTWASVTPPAGTYRLRLTTATVTIEADGLTSRDALADELEAKVNASADGVTAFESDGVVRLWRPDKGFFAPLVEALDGAPATEFTVVEAVLAPSLAGYWTGSDV